MYSFSCLPVCMFVSVSCATVGLSRSSSLLLHQSRTSRSPPCRLPAWLAPAATPSLRARQHSKYKLSIQHRFEYCDLTRISRS